MATNRNRVGTSTDSLMSSSPFVGGLNTELSGIVDSTEFTKDELNMLIRADGSRSRRPGVDYEELYRFNNDIIDVSKKNIAFNCIEWYDHQSPDEVEDYRQTPYIVAQIGSRIIFYKNLGQPFSRYEESFTLDLTTYALPDKDPSEYRCKFTVAYGCLFITSEAIQPIRFRGIEEDAPPIPPGTYPTCTVSCAAFQGKHQRMCSANWTYDLLPESKQPANNPAYYEVYFDNSLVMHVDVPVPAGYHEITTFPNSYTIAESFNALSNAARRGITATPHENAPDTWTEPNEGKYNWTPADWIDFEGSTSTVRGMKIDIKVFGWCYYSGDWKKYDNTYTAYMSGGSTNYTMSTGLTLQIRDTSVGAKDYLAIETNPLTLSYAHLYNLLNQGWTADLIGEFYIKTQEEAQRANRYFPGNNLAQQYLKDKKTDRFKPEDIINMTFGNTPAARGHFQMHYFEQDRNSLGSLVSNMQAVVTALNKYKGADEAAYTLTDIRDAMGYTGTEADIAEKQVPVVYPRRNYVVDLTTYAGRIFYLTGSTLLYSQMITEDIERADRCYTQADPTSEEMSDVVETDGGIIELPDIGEGLKLAQVGQNLLVFGTRGNAILGGTANNIFTATAYSAGSLNSVPTQAPDSFVNTEYGLFYWGTTGINFIGPGEGGLQVQDLSTGRILTWFGKLSDAQHKYCKGVYSHAKKKVYWFYPSDIELPRRLDCVLVYDITRQAFVPSKVATGFFNEEAGEYTESNVPEIVSGLSLKVPFRENREYPVTVEVTEEGSEVEMEVTSDNAEEAVDDFDGYRDAAQSLTELTQMVKLTTYPGDTSKGCVIRCDTSNITAGATEVVLKLRDYNSWNIVKTISIQKSADGQSYSVQYANDPPLVGFSSSDVLWFVIANDWRNNQYKTYIGCAPESSVSGSNFTAQNVPDAIIARAKSISKYISNYTGNSIVAEMNTQTIGNLAEGFSFVDIDNSNNTFLSRSGELVDDQEYYYMRNGTTEIYDSSFTQVGTLRKTYTNYIDFEKQGLVYYRAYEYDGIAPSIDTPLYYYVCSNLYSEHPPVFIDDSGVLTLYGFGNDIAPASGSFVVTPINGEADFTVGRRASKDKDGVREIVVLERDPSKDTYIKYSVNTGDVKILADDPIDSEAFTYESSILLCLDVANGKVTFGDFRNNCMRDWTAGDYMGPGYVYDSYLISHPMNATQVSSFTGRRITDIVHSKNLPYLITYFRRIETGELTTGEYVYPSGCQGSILWDWRTSGKEGKWSSPTELYRPDRRTIFEQGYIVNKTNIRGLGRSYQVKLESDGDKQFILEGLVYDLKNDGRI